MLNKNVNIIYWDNHGSDTYLYGTDISFDDNAVTFSNSLMPAGTVIKKWASKVNYQMNRVTSQAPLLEENRKYKIKKHIEELPQDTLYIKINFYDRYNNVVGSYTIRSEEDVFEVPQERYYYTVELINAGCESFKFYSLQIMDAKLDASYKNGYNITDFEKESNSLAVIFEEPTVGLANYIDKDILAKFSNYAVISSSYLDAKHYRDKGLEKSIEEKLMNTQIENIFFIGYGKISNEAAKYYANKYNKLAFVSGDKKEVEGNINYYPTEKKEENLMTPIIYDDNKLEDCIVLLEKV